MICFIALIVFGILAIFSVSYRPLAKEAFECVWLKSTFRKCKGNLDARIKSAITGKFLKYSPTSARFLYKNFELFSWLFVIILVVSLVYSGYSIYALASYGNCNGPDSDEVCIFNPKTPAQTPKSCTELCNTPECTATPEACTEECDCSSCAN